MLQKLLNLFGLGYHPKEFEQDKRMAEKIWLWMLGAVRVNPNLFKIVDKEICHFHESDYESWIDIDDITFEVV